MDKTRVDEKDGGGGPSEGGHSLEILQRQQGSVFFLGGGRGGPSVFRGILGSTFVSRSFCLSPLKWTLSGTKVWKLSSI